MARKKGARVAAKPRKRVLRAGDLMTREPITVSEEMSIADLCDLFQEKNINGAPVVDRRGRLVGVVAQDDIIYGAMGHADPLPAAVAVPPGGGYPASGHPGGGPVGSDPIRGGEPAGGAPGGAGHGEGGQGPS